jgi:hypothetical protein
LSSCLAGIEYGCYLKEWIVPLAIMPFTRASQLRPESLNFRRPATPKVVTGPSEPRAGNWGTAKKTLLLRTNLVEYFLFSAVRKLIIV